MISLSRSAGLPLVIALMFPAQSAHAFIQRHNDEAAFIAATQATSATGPLPESGAVATPLLLGDVELNLAAGATALHVGGSTQQTTLLSGAEISVEGTFNLDLEMAAPVWALGFSFAEPAIDVGPGQSYVDSEFEITLRDASAVVGRFRFNAADDAASFIGVSSSRPFSFVGIREITGGGDWEFIGEILTSSVATAIEVPESGEVPLVLEAFDAELRAYLDESAYPGLTAAVTYDGRLIYRRSIGWTDAYLDTPLHFNSPMALASLTKPLTETLVRNQFRAGLLTPNQRMTDVLQLTPILGMPWVAGFTDITISHLLDHRSGLQRTRPDNVTVGNLLGLGRPATFAEVLSWAGTQPLLFVPGAGNSYSNFGYNVLGAISEVATGLRYERAVTETLGEPLGAFTIRSPSEEPYLADVPAGVIPATIYNSNDAAGSMLASAPDYCRFLRAFRLTGAPKSSATPAGNFFFSFTGSVDEALTFARQRHTGGHALEWVIFCNDRGYTNSAALDNRTAPHLLAITQFPDIDLHPYLNWKMERFWDSGLGVLEAGAADEEDIDSDGLKTLEEYAFQRDPLLAEGSSPFGVTIGNDNLPVVGFPRVPAHVDLSYVLEHSVDLLGWNGIAESHNGGALVPLDDEQWTVIETAGSTSNDIEVRPSAPANAGFFRLRLDASPAE